MLRLVNRLINHWPWDEHLGNLAWMMTICTWSKDTVLLQKNLEQPPFFYHLKTFKLTFMLVVGIMHNHCDMHSNVLLSFGQKLYVILQQSSDNKSYLYQRQISFANVHNKVFSALYRKTTGPEFCETCGVFFFKLSWLTYTHTVRITVHLYFCILEIHCYILHM